MGKNQVTIFAVIYVELMQQGAISSKELGLFFNFILEMDCCIYIDTTVVSKNIYFINKQFLSWDSSLLVCLFMLEEGVLELAFFFFKQSRSYGVYQAILCNNCKYSLNNFETIKVYFFENLYLRDSSFLFLMVEKSYILN